jgi:hypothetical protein
MQRTVFALWPLALGSLAWIFIFILPAADSGNTKAIFILGIAALFYVVTLVRAVISPADRMITVNFCIYNIFMFLIPGMHHCFRGYFPFFEMEYPAETIEYAANIVFLFSCMFFVGQEFGSRRFRMAAPVNQLRAPSVRNMTLLSLLSILVAIGFGAIQGFDTFIVKRSIYFELAGATTPLELIVNAMARYPIFVGFVIATVRLKQRPSLEAWVIALATFATFMFMNYPLAIPRTYLFGYIIVVLLLYIDFRKPLNKFVYVSACVFAIIFVFGLADDLTRHELSMASFNFLERYLASSDFDGFQSTINVVIYVHDLGLGFGRNILSALLFFVPRWAWSGKSMGTGVDAAENLELDFTNVSAPIAVETYVDFGLVGVLLCALLIGWFMARIDQKSSFFRSSSSPLERLVPCILGGFVIILARGSLVAIIGPFALLFVFSKFAVWFAYLNTRVSQRRRLDSMLRT